MPEDTPLDAYDRDGAEPQQVRADVSFFKKRKYFSVRAWYLDDETYRPSKNGINLPVEEYPRFRELIKSLDEKLGYDPSKEPEEDA